MSLTSMLPDTDPVTTDAALISATDPSIGAAANEPTLLQGQVRILGGSHPRVSKAPSGLMDQIYLL